VKAYFPKLPSSYYEEENFNIILKSCLDAVITTTPVSSPVTYLVRSGA